MKVFVATGGPHSGHERVLARLQAHGVVAARPGRKEGMTAQALAALMLRADDTRLDGDAPLEQLALGRVWDELAADLFLANLELPLWGWSDQQVLPLLDFWLDFDPQVCLLLTYATPQAHLARAFEHDAAPAADAVAAELAQWQRWNTALLRYFHRHPERCVLLDSAAAERSGALAAALKAHWSLPGFARDAGVPPCTGRDTLPAFFAGSLIDAEHPVWALLQELESSAQLPADLLETRWGDWVALRGELDGAAALRTQAEKQDREQSAAQQRLLELQTRLEQQAAAPRPELAGELAELAAENELLLQQLHQVQEELERLFLAAQGRAGMRGAGDADFWLLHQPRRIALDMRRDIAGGNWYAAEVDGRWAGPATVSTLDFPPLQAGDYRLELDVVAAMAPEIVASMTLEAFGRPLAFAVEPPLSGHAYPLACVATLVVPDQLEPAPWQLKLTFARLVSPAELGSDDRRHLALRLRRVSLEKLDSSV